MLVHTRKRRRRAVRRERDSLFLIGDRDRALLLDIGTGARRFLTDPACSKELPNFTCSRTSASTHVCGLPYLYTLPVSATVWAPGAWLYRTDTAAILEPLRRPLIAPSDATESHAVNELHAGTQLIGGFEVRASPQPRHWALSAGLRVADHIALITDTPYEAALRTRLAGLDGA